MVVNEEKLDHWFPEFDLVTERNNFIYCDNGSLLLSKSDNSIL